MFLKYGQMLKCSVHYGHYSPIFVEKADQAASRTRVILVWHCKTAHCSDVT